MIEVSKRNLNRVSLFSSKCYHLTFDPSLPPSSPSLSPFRYRRQPGRERAPAHGHDWPVEQPEGAAPGGPRGAEEAGCLADGEAEAADGTGQAAAGPGIQGATLHVKGFTWKCCTLYAYAAKQIQPNKSFSLAWVHRIKEKLKQLLHHLSLIRSALLPICRYFESLGNPPYFKIKSTSSPLVITPKISCISVVPDHKRTWLDTDSES